MTELLMLAGSLAAVALVVFAVRLTGMGKARIANDKEAAILAEAIAADFIAGSVLLDRDGRSALVADARGRGFVIMKQAGSHASGRFLRSVAIERNGNALIIDSGDRWFGSVSIVPESVGALDAIPGLTIRGAHA